MAGINLSQSLLEKETEARGSFFDKGLYANIAFLVLVLAVFGGVRWYLGNLNKQIASLDQEIAAKSDQLKGEEVERVADLRDRLDMIKEALPLVPDPIRLAAEIEEAIVPNVRLTRYEEDWESQAVVLEGVTDNLKYIAQTMLVLKKNPSFTKVAVSGIKYNDEGIIEFGLVATRASSKNQQ